MPTEEELRNELALLRQRHQMKIGHFNQLHSVAKHMKTDIRELEKRIDDLEKKILRKVKSA